MADYGSGSIEERSPGVWRLRAYVGRDPLTGKPRQVQRTIRTAKRGGKTEAREAMKGLLAEARAGATSSAATVSRLFDEWLPHIERQGLSHSTVATYRSHAKKRIVPELGDLRLDRLTAHDLDAFYARLLDDEELAIGTVKLNHAILSAALGQALKWGWISANPARAASPPKGKPESHEPPSVEDVQRLISAAVEDDVDLGALLALAAVTGARRGELVGLKWTDVDEVAGTLTISRSVVPGKGGPIVGTTKTGKARMVALGPFGLEVLRRYKVAVTERQEGVEPLDDGWLLSYDGGSSHLSAKAVSVYVSRLGARLDPPMAVHLHQLRHFAATWLVGSGTDVRTVAARLGHSSTAMTLDVYTHALPEQDQDAARRLGEALMSA